MPTQCGKMLQPVKRAQLAQKQRKALARPTVGPTPENAPQASFKRKTGKSSASDSKLLTQFSAYVVSMERNAAFTLASINERIDFHRTQWEQYSRLRDKLKKRSM